MWWEANNKTFKQSKFEPFVGMALWGWGADWSTLLLYLTSSSSSYIPILSGVCYLINSSDMSAAVSPPCIIAHQSSLSSSLNVFVIIILVIMSYTSVKTIRRKSAIWINFTFLHIQMSCRGSSDIMCVMWRMSPNLFSFVAKFVGIYAVLLQNLFCCDLCAFARRTFEPKCLSVEKMTNISYGQTLSKILHLLWGKQWCFM